MSPATTPISVVVVEDDTAYRDELCAHLIGAPDIEIPATYASIEEALSANPGPAVAVVLLDVNLPGMSGVAGIPELLSHWGDIEVVMLTVLEEAGVVFEALEAGATGYLAKSALPEQIVAAVREVTAGGAPMSSTIARKVIARFHRAQTGGGSPLPELTDRENELLAQLAEGRLDKEIADSLGISLPTVKTHLRNIYRKLQVQNRTEAARRYLRRG